MARKVTIEEVEKPQIKTGIPVFRAGDTVRVHTIVKEGARERIQVNGEAADAVARDFLTARGLLK